MVDIFALSVPHFVLVVALWRLMQRDDLDQEGSDAKPDAGRERQPRA